MKDYQLIFRDRFVNNDVLKSISRPQYRYSCSLTALSAVINYLFSRILGIQTQEQIANLLGLDARCIGYNKGPGNKQLMKWFNTFTSRTSQNAKCRIFMNKREVIDWSRNEKMIRKFKETIKSKNRILIYHLDNHFNVVCGFFESALVPFEAFAKNTKLKRWILLADHWSGSKPIYSIRWRDIRNDFLKNREHCFIVFEKTPE